MLNDNEVLVGGQICRYIKLLVVASVIFNSDGFCGEVVRAEEVHLQGARATFCGSTDIEFVALCNDSCGRNCREERLLQVDRDGCILGVRKLGYFYRLAIILIDGVGRLTVGELAGCIDRVCTRVDSDLGGVPLVFPRVVGLNGNSVTWLCCSVCSPESWKCLQDNTIGEQILSGYEQVDGVTVSVGSGEFNLFTNVVRTVTGC